MSSEKFIMVVALVACAACAVAGKALPLSIASDITICKTNITLDKNDARIPQVIKLIKCAAEPYEMCPINHGDPEDKAAPCCGRALDSDEQARFSCIDVVEDVQVMKAADRTSYVMSVAVGCSCIKQTLVTANTLPD